MTDRNRRLLLGAVILAILGGLAYFRYKKYELPAETVVQKTQTTKQAVKSSVASVDRAKSQYVSTRDKNIAKEKEVAKNAVEEGLCEMYSNDTDALLGWVDLVARSRKYNGQWSNSSSEH